MKISLYFFTLCFLLTACVSKKKHNAEIQLLKRTHQDTLSTVSNDLKRQIRHAKDTITSLQLNLAERKGENNVLNMLRGELTTQIEQLELQIETLGNKSQTNQSSLNNTLAKKEKEIETLQLQLANIEKAMNGRQEAFKKLSGDLLYAFQEMPFTDFEAINTDQGLKVTFPKSVFFKRGYTSSIQKKGQEVMEAAAAVISRYPVMQLTVVGHTNNTPTRSKSIKDNWSISALQAATIVNTFADVYDVNTSQLTASGKGEFEPKASNETKEGKTLNDRIEWRISQRDADLERAIRKVLKK